MIKGIGGALGPITIILIVLKLAGVIGWGWPWVLAPTWIPMALGLILMFLVGLLGRSELSQEKRITIGFAISCVILLVVNYVVQKDMREVGLLDLIFGGFPLVHIVILGGGTALIIAILNKLIPPTK